MRGDGLPPASSSLPQWSLQVRKFKVPPPGGAVMVATDGALGAAPDAAADPEAAACDGAADEGAGVGPVVGLAGAAELLHAARNAPIPASAEATRNVRPVTGCSTDM